MPRKQKTSSKPRIRRSSFHASLRLAKSMYESKVQRRIAIMHELEDLNAAIPKLEVTLQALEAQLGVESEIPVKPPGYETTVQKIKRQMERLDEIPAEIRAQLPPETTSGMSSRYGDDFLPEITGKEVVEKK